MTMPEDERRCFQRPSLTSSPELPPCSSICTSRKRNTKPPTRGACMPASALITACGGLFAAVALVLAIRAWGGSSRGVERRLGRSLESTVGKGYAFLQTSFAHGRNLQKIGMILKLVSCLCPVYPSWFAGIPCPLFALGEFSQNRTGCGVA